MINEENRTLESRTLETSIANSYIGWQLALPVLGLAGMGISGYLTYVHYQNINAICLFNANCDKVLTSPYSQIWGIPLSLFGLAMYAGLTLLGVLNLVLYRRIEGQNWPAGGIYALSLAGVIFSLYLYYLEIFEIHAFCTWCIGSSIVMLIIFIISLINLKASGFKFKEYPRWLRVRVSRYVQW